MTDEDFARIAQLPLSDFAWALLDCDPKLSSSDLVELARVAKPNVPTPTKRAMQVYREAWKRARAGGVDSGEPVPDASNIRAAAMRDAEARMAVGDARGASAALDVVNRIDGIATGASGENSTEDWSRMSEPERACLAALTRKLNGEELEPDDQWFVALLARAPERRTEKHPAHLPLPEAERPPIVKT